MATASKNIVAELNRGEKLNGDNYEIWSMKIQYVLEEQEALEVLNVVLDAPEEGNTAQHRRDREAYEAWKRKNSLARITLLSSMENDIMREFRNYNLAKDMWSALKTKFGGTSVTKLRSLTIKFDTYKKKHEHSMKKHLREMSNMICELNDAGHVLTDEQQVQAIIRSLPHSWEHMKMHLTHNENIKTMDDVVRHLELEEERLEATKLNTDVYMASSSSGKVSGRKRKYKGGSQEKRNKATHFSKKSRNNQHGKGKRPFKKNMAKIKCFNCNKKGHFARDCPEPKKVLSYTHVNELCVASSVFLTDSHPLWIVDSGATDHVAKDRDTFVEFRRIPHGAKWIYVGNNARVAVQGIGTCKLVLRGGRTLLLHDVLYAPQICRNLISVLVLLKLGFTLYLADNNIELSLGTTHYGSGYIINGFIVMDTDRYECNLSYSMFTSSHNSEIDANVWHARLGHISQHRMDRLAKEGLLPNYDKVDLSTCEHCLAGKSTRKPFGKGTRADFPLQLIHSDICGPMNVRARHGAFYFITFIDDFTRFGIVYLIKHKSEALNCFQSYMSLVENQLDRKIKALRTDRGREYLSDQFRQLCDEKGIQRQLTNPRTPQQNGVAERRNRTLLEMVRSMMAQANLPITYWGDALLTATFILNRVPSKSVPTTPYELWTTRTPDLSILRPWGCAAYVLDTSHPHGKLGARGKKCIFIRYSEHSKGYVFIGEHDSGSLTEFESRDVTFLENDFPKQGDINPHLSLYETMDMSDQDSLPSSGRILGNMFPIPNANDSDLDQHRSNPNGNTQTINDPSSSGSDLRILEKCVSPEPQLRRSGRKGIPRRRFDIEGGEAFVAITQDEDEPRNIKEALSGPNKENWTKAMEEEMESMRSNQVWELVDLPNTRKAIGNKWVLKVKRKADGTIEKYKARLVAKGYTQQEGIDYERIWVELE